jgi:5-methylthioadenosine/S-adenosylhomocysteine deaminase
MTILGGFLVTSAHDAPKPGWGVRIEQSCIREVASNEVLLQKYPGGFLDARDKVIQPGFINTHMHMYSSLTQGRYFAKTYADVHEKLVDYIWRQVEDKLDHEAIRASTGLCAAMLIRNGITTATDIMEAPYALPGGLDISAEVIDSAGLRAVLMFEATERVSPENGRLGLQENERFIRQYPTGKGRISGMVSAHTTFSCSLDFLKQARSLADRLGSYIHMFVSESYFEPLHCLKTYGKLPFEVYDDIGFLGPDVLASMAVHVQRREIPIITRRNVNIAHIPLSAANPGVGMAPISDYLAHGVTVGLTSYPFFNYFETMRATIWMHRAHCVDSGIMPVKTVFEMATEGAARAIGLGSYVGTLEEGKFADLLLVKANFIPQVTPENLLDLIVFHRNPQDIDTVIINGEIVMKNGTVITVDEERAIEEVRRTINRLWSKELATAK